MKNIKKFEVFSINEELTPGDEGIAAAKRDSYNSNNNEEDFIEDFDMIDEITLNLRALTEKTLSEILNILKNEIEIIPDETNEEAIEIITKFKD